MQTRHWRLGTGLQKDLRHRVYIKSVTTLYKDCIVCPCDVSSDMSTDVNDLLCEIYSLL